MDFKMISYLLLVFIIAVSCSEDPTSTPDKQSIVTGTVTDIDGNEYRTVKIGDQWWMAENLKVTKYQNGDIIRNITKRLEWEDINLRSGACCVYDNIESNADTFGLLYNWYAVNDSRNIAPAGWHVATREEWEALVDTLGGPIDAGIKMVDISSDHWKNPDPSATNESGFSVLPAGLREFNGEFRLKGSLALFWTSTRSSRNGYSEVIEIQTNRSYYVSIPISSWKKGYSVRCIKD